LVRASLERRTLGRPKWEPIAAVPDFVVMGHVPVPHDADLEDQDRMQIGEVLAALDEILGGDLIGAFFTARSSSAGSDPAAISTCSPSRRDG
jgi:hypothetical protein